MDPTMLPLSLPWHYHERRNMRFKGPGQYRDGPPINPSCPSLQVEADGYREVQAIARHLRRRRREGLGPPHKGERLLIKNGHAGAAHDPACAQLTRAVERE